MLLHSGGEMRERYREGPGDRFLPLPGSGGGHGFWGPESEGIRAGELEKPCFGEGKTGVPGQGREQTEERNAKKSGKPVDRGAVFA